MKARIGGAWRDITSAQVRIGGTWRAITSAKAYIGGAWRDIASFIQPLSLAISPSSINRTRTEGEPFTTQNATATPTGGRGPFTYSVARVSGDTVFTITAPTSATSAFSIPGLAEGTYSTVFRWTCTDADGRVDTEDLTVTVNVVFDPFGGVG